MGHTAGRQEVRLGTTEVWTCRSVQRSARRNVRTPRCSRRARNELQRGRSRDSYRPWRSTTETHWPTGPRVLAPARGVTAGGVPRSRVRRPRPTSRCCKQRAPIYRSVRAAEVRRVGRCALREHHGDQVRPTPTSPRRAPDELATTEVLRQRLLQVVPRYALVPTPAQGAFAAGSRLSRVRLPMPTTRCCRRCGPSRRSVRVAEARHVGRCARQEVRRGPVWPTRTTRRRAPDGWPAKAVWR